MIYAIEDKKHQSLRPLKEEKENSLPRMRQRKNRIEIIEMNISNNDSQNTPRNKVVRLNTAAQNPIFLEVSHIILMALTISSDLMVVAVKKQIHEKFLIRNFPQALLCFLDLAFPLAWSVIIPLMVYVRNREIQKYIRGFFQC